MKSLFAIALIAVSAQASAGFFLESFYGELAVVNGKYTCTLTNENKFDEDSTDERVNGRLEIRHVQFNFERRVGKNRAVVETKNVRTVLSAGDTITVSSNAGRELIAESCKFLVR